MDAREPTPDAQATTPDAQATTPDDDKADFPAPPWFLRAGLLSRSLLMSIEQDGAHNLSYWPDNTDLITFTGGYRGFILGFSLSAARINSKTTHGTSSGYDLRASFPLEVTNRQLFLSGIAQRYRGFDLKSPQTGSSPLDREDITAKHFELAASYFLDPTFDFSSNFVELIRNDGIEDSLFARAVTSLSTVSGRQLLVPADYADEYGANASVSALRAYALHALAGYALHLSWAGVFANASLALGFNGALALREGHTERIRTSLSPALQFAIGIGIAHETWHAAMLLDTSAHEVFVREMGVTWMPIQMATVVGIRF